MPDGRKHLVAGDIGLIVLPWGMEDHSPTIRIKIAMCLMFPADITEVLPRIVEVVVRVARTEHHEVIRIRERPEYPAERSIFRRTHFPARRDIQAADTELEWQLAEIAGHRAHLLLLLFGRMRKAEFLFAIVSEGDLFRSILAYLFYLIFNDFLPFAFQMRTDDDLHPGLFVLIEIVQYLKDLRERFDFEFFFGVLIEFEIHIRLDGKRVDALIMPVDVK